MGTIRGKALFDTVDRFGTGALCSYAWLAILSPLFGVRGIFAFLKVLVSGVLLYLGVSSAFGQPSAKNILVIYSSFNREASPFLDTIESSVRARVPEKVNFYVMYPESSRWDDEAYRQSLAETLHLQYEGVKLDLVMAVSYPAFPFTLQYRDKIFPGVPIVITGLDRERLPGQKFSGVTGVACRYGIPETIDLALHLHPDADTVAVIASDSHLHWTVAHSELLRRKVKEIDIFGPPDSHMLERVTALPPHTVVLFQVFASESTHPAVGVYDVLDAVASRFPTYSAWPNLALDHGGVGGAYHDSSHEARLTGEIAARVLSGERADDIPIVSESGLQIQVDWRALRRWHIPESALPPGTLILYREPTLWERDRKYIIPALALIAAQLILIVGLFWQRARKRKAEAVLRESEERFRVMADTTPSLIWMCDVRGSLTYLNDQWFAFTGADPDAGYGDLWVTYIHPDDLKNVSDVLSHALKVVQPFSQECRLRRSDGTHRWILSVASPRVNGDGSFAGFIGSAIDVTDQKLASQALEKVSGQLIEAQEKERSRIARDLHDDICQRLALLSMELDQAEGSSDGSSGTTKENLERIRKHCSEIADDVQSLSHQLHSSKLELLGIAAAIKGFCKEFSKQHEVNIEFTERDVPQYLPKDMSLCLFRVTQEALHNAVKYSGTSNFTVQIHATAEEVQLAVSDSGAGFDVEEAKRNQGLGLVSMQERVHLVHGKLLIESEPGKGTKILALVPMVPENQNAFEDRTARHAERVKEVA